MCGCHALQQRPRSKNREGLDIVDKNRTISLFVGVIPRGCLE
jgi:hypothetical protein